LWASRDTGEQNNSKPDPRALIWSTSNTHLPDTTTLPRRHGSQPIAGARAAAQRRVPYIHLQHYTPPPRGARARTTHARTIHAPSPPPPPPPLRARAHAGYNPRRGRRGCVARSCFVLVIRWRRIQCRRWCSSAVGKPASPMPNAKRSHAPPGAIPWPCAPRAARRPCAVSGSRQLAASN